MSVEFLSSKHLVYNYLLIPKTKYYVSFSMA